MRTTATEKTSSDDSVLQDAASMSRKSRSIFLTPFKKSKRKKKKKKKVQMQVHDEKSLRDNPPDSESTSESTGPSLNDNSIKSSNSQVSDLTRPSTSNTAHTENDNSKSFDSGVTNCTNLSIATMFSGVHEDFPEEAIDECNELIEKLPHSSIDPEDTPLHLACRDPKPDSFMIGHLLKSTIDSTAEYDTSSLKEMVFKTNSFNELPLHVATKSEKSHDEKVINALIDAHPDSVQMPDKDQSLPIHLACMAGVPSSLILKILMGAYPESYHQKTKLLLPAEKSDKTARGNLKNDGRDDEDSIIEPQGFFCDCNSFYPFKFDMSFESEESDFAPLHLAILNHASPEAIDLLVSENTMESLNMETSKGRKPIDCAKAMVVDKNKDDENISDEDKLAFATIEILETCEKNMYKQNHLKKTISRTELSLRYLHGTEPDEKVKVKEVEKAVEKEAEEEEEEEDSLLFSHNVCEGGNLLLFPNKYNVCDGIQPSPTAELVYEMKTKKSALGERVRGDREIPATCPKSFELPINLDHVNLDEVVPVGFRRLRWAILSSQSKFITDTFLGEDQKLKKIKMGKWNKFDDIIGEHHSPEHQDISQFIGASRKCQYLMPKSGFVSANTAHQEITILEYSDHCFAVKMITRNPEVPYGKTFEAHTQHVFINVGEESCRVICSVSTVFVGKQPMIGWKIRNAMYSGTMSSDVSLMEAICVNAAD